MKSRLIAAVTLAASLLTSMALAAPDSGKEVRIGYQASSHIILLAKAKGFYDKEFAKDGTKVTYNLFLSGAPMLEAVSGDRLDLIQTGDMPPVAGRAAGIDLKVIANSGFDPAHNAVLVAPGSAIKSVRDLKGKKVAVPVGTSAHHFLYLLLAKNGLKPADIQLVNLAAPELAKTLETKNVDAIAVWEPFTTNIELSGKAKVLVDSTNIKRAFNAYIARNGFARENPQLVERFLRATKQATDYYKKHPKEAQQAISDEGKFPLPVVARINNRYNLSLGITGKDVKALEQVKDFLRENKVLKKEFAINELFDTSYLKRTGIK
jgi:sulfonate transport system substrate-binding protein